MIKKADFFSNLSIENGNFLDLSSSFEILKVLTHYQFVNDQRLQITIIHKTWLHILGTLFCDQIQFSSIHFEDSANNDNYELKNNFESKNTIFEEEDENNATEPAENFTDPSIKILDGIDINNPIQINANKKRKQGVHDNQKERQKYYTSKGVSFKDIDNPPLDIMKDRSRNISFDRSLTFESEVNSETLDMEFLSLWIQSILVNLAEHMPGKQLKKLIAKKDSIRFFNEDLLDDEVIKIIFFNENY